MTKDMIVLYSSASKWGTVDVIREWHLERGWSDIGYNLVILNGYTDPKMVARDPELDGHVEVGRDLNDNPWDYLGETGAHALGYNQRSVGICFIQDPGQRITRRQMQRAFVACAHICDLCDIPWQNVVGHKELDKQKSDPYHLEMNMFRNQLVRHYLYYMIGDFIYKPIAGGDNLG